MTRPRPLTALAYLDEIARADARYQVLADRLRQSIAEACEKMEILEDV